jgi:AcrR family transcriptional regulator
MAKGVQSRRYESPRRREQAEATRAQILDAAKTLFERDGYAGTSIAAIAKQAGVAMKTVYLGFETKSGLLRALWNRELRGGKEEVPVAEQPWFREVVEEPDPEKVLRLNARNGRARKESIASLGQVIFRAAPIDPEIAALWQRIQTQFHENQRLIVEALHGKKALKKGLGVDEATDILWTLNHPEVYLLLVGERGWSGERYEKWLGDIFVEQLLR